MGSGMGSGTGPGTGSGTGPGTGPGMASGTGSGTGSGMGSGTESGTGSGMESGIGTGTGSCTERLTMKNTINHMRYIRDSLYVMGTNHIEFSVRKMIVFIMPTTGRTMVSFKIDILRECTK
jgi:hypothetical protein